MGMPKNLVLVRHGESEANILQRKRKADANFVAPQIYGETPDREVRLSDLGREQTKLTGDYLKKEYPNGFDIVYVSDHTRAKETGALVCIHAGWKNVKIKIEPQFGERNWGTFHLLDYDKRKAILDLKKRDPLHTAMPDGETLLDARNRTRVLLDRAARQYEGKNVLLFTHGEYIESVWAEIAHMRTEEQISFFESPMGNIQNCQVIEFQSNEKNKITKFKTSNPHLNEFGDWAIIDKKVFSPEELLEEVNSYGSILKDKP